MLNRKFSKGCLSNTYVCQGVRACTMYIRTFEYLKGGGGLLLPLDLHKCKVFTFFPLNINILWYAARVSLVI